jgi:hypothetical protein
VVTETDIKQSLAAEMSASAFTPAEAIYEFWVPRSNERADVALVGSNIDGFEIKTARDSLRRLPRQVDAYTRVFDRCHAVLAHRHIDAALEILPAWWGVLVVDEGLTFMTLRPAQPNLAVDSETLVRLLWRDEAFAALCELEPPPDRRAGRYRLWEMLLACLDAETLKTVVRQALLARDASRARIASRRYAVS